MPSPHPIQQSIKDYLGSHDWFQTPRPIPIFTQDEGDLQGRIRASLGALDGGLAILVTVPSGVNTDPRSPRVCLNNTVEIRALELPLINRAATGLRKTAYATTRILGSPFFGAQKGLHGWRPGAPCGAVEFLEYDSEIDPTDGTWVYVAKFSFQETL